MQDLLAGASVPADRLGTLADIRLDVPRPLQDPVPMLVGGTSATLLRWAGAHAQAVGLTGLGPTGDDGHTHPVAWSSRQLERHLAAIHEGAATADRAVPAIEVLVQAVEVTDDADAAHARLAAEPDTTAEELAAAPYVLIGTEVEILAKMRSIEQRWGISRYTVREPALAVAAGLLRAAGSSAVLSGP